MNNSIFKQFVSDYIYLALNKVSKCEWQCWSHKKLFSILSIIKPTFTVLSLKPFKKFTNPLKAHLNVYLICKQQ